MKSISTFFLFTTILTYSISNLFAQYTQVAIVQNFSDEEIDQLQSYLAEMQISSKVFEQQGLTVDSLQEFDLIIWDDLGYQGDGITDNDVYVFVASFTAGIPLYLIGDDLAYSAINLSDTAKTEWTNLIHLYGTDNFSGADSVLIMDVNHPVTNGQFGAVGDFQYSEDIDGANRAATGETVLAISNINHDIILVYEDVVMGVRTVTQNVMVYNGGNEKSREERKTLFKNAIAWLLEGEVGVSEEMWSDDNAYRLPANYPNPFNPVTTIRYGLPEQSHVKIVIYNMLGQHVKQLVNSTQNAGYKSVIWDGTDEFGRSVGTGIYLYQIKARQPSLPAPYEGQAGGVGQAGDFTQTRKMLLLQ